MAKKRHCKYIRCNTQIDLDKRGIERHKKPPYSFFCGFHQHEARAYHKHLEAKRYLNEIIETPDSLVIQQKLVKKVIELVGLEIDFIDWDNDPQRDQNKLMGNYR